MVRRFVILSAALVIAAIAMRAADKDNNAADIAPDPGSYVNSVIDFHKVVPLGMDTVRLDPARELVSMLASVTSPGFEGMRRSPVQGKVRLRNASGKPVRSFPGELDFRVTAEQAQGKTAAENPVALQTAMTSAQFMLSLRFRLKVFHGLDSFYLEPTSVEQIGPPADVPSVERIYIAHFRLEQIPATDRLLLEVLTPGGERVLRFHMELL
jgi:hypothetical protein